MKLNLVKCVFRVRCGKLLGFVVSETSSANLTEVHVISSGLVSDQSKR